jgi:glycosyltransferase involved in cell wall biosynthesis
MKVSVVIPVYNREKELVRAIESVLRQSVSHFEILVVDDHSTLDLKPVLDQFKDERIRYFKLSSKGNANICRNLGIREAAGKYIALLDSDDEWLPDHLASKMEALVKKNVDGVFGSICVNHGNTNREVISRPLRNGEKMVNYLLSDGMAQTSTYFFKAEAVKQVEWNESLERHQDWDFIIRFSAVFKLSPVFSSTCIVHWISGERKFEHFDSRRRFIDLYRKDIAPQLYNEYHRKVYIGIFRRNEVQQELKVYYRKEALKHLQHVTLNDFLEMHDLSASGRLYRFYLRLLFAFKIVSKR